MILLKEGPQKINNFSYEKHHSYMIVHLALIIYKKNIEQNRAQARSEM